MALGQRVTMAFLVVSATITFTSVLYSGVVSCDDNICIYHKRREESGEDVLISSLKSATDERDKRYKLLTLVSLANDMVILMIGIAIDGWSGVGVYDRCSRSIDDDRW